MGMRIRYEPPTRNVAILVDKAAEVGITAVGEAILRTAQDHCPKETERLADSGHTTPKGRHGVIISFGMDDAEYAYGHVLAATKDYAVIQHEDATLNHPNGGESHFLHKSVSEDTFQLLEMLADPIREALL